MKKNFFILVLAMFSMCTYADVTLSGNDDETPIHQIPHRSPARKPSITINGESASKMIYINFMRDLSDVTIEVYYEGVLVDSIEESDVIYGQMESVSADSGNGEYTVVVHSEGEIVIEKTVSI